MLIVKHGKQSVSYQVTKIWNSIPQEINVTTGSIQNQDQTLEVYLFMQDLQNLYTTCKFYLVLKCIYYSVHHGIYTYSCLYVFNFSQRGITHSMWALLFWDVFNIFQNYFLSMPTLSKQMSIIWDVDMNQPDATILYVVIYFYGRIYFN